MSESLILRNRTHEMKLQLWANPSVPAAVGQMQILSIHRLETATFKSTTASPIPSIINSTIPTTTTTLNALGLQTFTMPNHSHMTTTDRFLDSFLSQYSQSMYLNSLGTIVFLLLFFFILRTLLKRSRKSLSTASSSYDTSDAELVMIKAIQQQPEDKCKRVANTHQFDPFHDSVVDLADFCPCSTNVIHER